MSDLPLCIKRRWSCYDRGTLHVISSNGICVFTFIFGCLPVPLVPMEYVSLRLYSDAYPCHRSEYKRKDTDSIGTIHVISKYGPGNINVKSK